VTRPRAADDFATIRTRLEELRRERAEVLASEQEREPEGPQPRRADAARPRPVRETGLLPSVRRALIR
jgi:hypothetical protein